MAYLATVVPGGAVRGKPRYFKRLAKRRAWACFCMSEIVTAKPFGKGPCWVFCQYIFQNAFLASFQVRVQAMLFTAMGLCTAEGVASEGVARRV
jgi:hypothetical protein